MGWGGWGDGFPELADHFRGDGMGGMGFRPLAGGDPPLLVSRINRRPGLPIGLSLRSPFPFRIGFGDGILYFTICAFSPRALLPFMV